MYPSKKQGLAELWHAVKNSVILTLFIIAFSLIKLNGQQAILDSTGSELFNLSSLLAPDNEIRSGMLIRKADLAAPAKAANIKRLSLARLGNRKRGIVISANNLGIIFFKEGNLMQALSYFQEALKSAEDLSDKNALALIRGEIGFVNHNSGDFSKATAFYMASYKLFTENKVAKGIAVMPVLLGDAYFKKKDYDSAFFYFQMALKIPVETGNSKITAFCLNKSGEIKMATQKYPQALDFYSQALKMSQAIHDSNSIANIYRNTGLVYFQQENYQKAETGFLNSLQFKDRARTTLKYLKDCYSKLLANAKVEKDNAKIKFYEQKYKEIKELLLREGSGENENQSLLKEELIEKENIISRLNIEKESQFTSLTQNELELKQKITETELENLNREKALENLNRTLSITEKAAQERDQEIENLKNDKIKLDLILVQNEKELYRKTKNNTILLAASVLILLAAFFMFNRYRYKRKSLSELNKAYTDLKSTQEQLIQSEKMASLGQLTAGIAHEIQNPLNFVNNFSIVSNELLNELNHAKTPLESQAIISDLKENLSRISEHGKRADAIVKAMLAHSRPGNTNKQPVDLNALCDESLTLAYTGFKVKDSSFHCQIIKKFEPDMPPAPLVVTDFSRVIFNLLNNAFYAVREKENRLSDKKNYCPTVELETKFNKNKFTITVSDNGSGIPPQIIDKVFNPFFTTKPSGSGTGLGLSLSYDIIAKGHGGKLFVESSPGQSATFSIEIPG